jgi:glycosyltransferase involved in cell wall biosynthesis
MRILVFHGYLLRGTGSNVYNARLAQALAREGHEVHLLCQERRPEELGFVGAAGDWDEGGSLVIHPLAGNPAITTYRPDLGGVLPVYVLDRYEGVEAKTFLDLTDAELEAYLARNVAAVREVAELVQPDIALANHLVMGPVILARALGGSVPYAVKVHGSDLEYVVKRDPERFVPYAREGLEPAGAALVGSRHTAESLWGAVPGPWMRDLARLSDLTRLGPPGVDVEEFRPRSPEDAAAGIRALATRLEQEAVEAARDGTAAAQAPSAFSRDLPGAAKAIARLQPGRDRHVAFVGKLIVSKGVDLLAAAWPLVLAAVPDARLVVIGFGAYREGLERLLGALAAGDLGAARALAQQGRAAEGGPEAPLRHLLAFLDDVEHAEDRDAYMAAAARLRDRVVLVGRLEHDELAPLLAASEAQVVPSTFPEAFGMVAAEAAASGALPVSAAHSGLAEVTAILGEAVPEPAREWLSFEVGPHAVRDLADRLIAWLQAPQEIRDATRDALVATARARFSWDGVARGVIAAAEGRLDELPEP